MSGSPAKHLANDFLKSASKVSGKGGINEWIDGGVAVAEPEDDGEGERGDALLAEGRDEVHGEEGEPAADEAAHDDAQRLRRLRLHPEPTHLRVARQQF